MDKRRGFTIVELLIVIIVIAILAAVASVTFSGIRVRSQATAIASDFKAIEKALLLYKNSLGLSSWPTDTDETVWTGGSNPTFLSLVDARPEFRAFMQKAPVVSGLGGPSSYYAFDNDVDTYNGCSTISSGVNIYITGTTTSAADTAVMQAVDDMIDDGSLTCGRVRSTGTSFHYNVARSVNG